MKATARCTILIAVHALLIAGLAFGVAFAASHPGRVGVKTLLLLPEALPDPPVRPLLWVTQPPVREEHTYESAAGRVEVDLYLPSGGGQHGGLILYTGAFGLRRDPAFVRVGEGLARAGAVVMVPESEALRSGELRVDEVDTLLKAVAYLRSRPEVDPNRVGVAGFSVGGSVALLAAEDETGRDQIAFVNVFGAYYDTRDLLKAIACHQIEQDGQYVDWEPVEVSVYIFTRQLVASLPKESDRDVLERALGDRRSLDPAELASLSPEARLIPELFERPTPERADAILAALPSSTRDYLAALSPSTRVDRLKARLYVMHGVRDCHIPVTQGRRLAAGAPPGVVVRYTVLRLFEHVRPDQRLSAPDLALDLLRLYRHLWLVAQEAL